MTAPYQSYPPSLWATPAPPGAVVTSLNPNTREAGSAIFALGVMGSNFLSDDVIVIGGTAYATAYQSATELRTNVTPPATAQVVPVLVRRGTTDTATISLTITEPPPPPEAPEEAPEPADAPESPTEPTEAT